MQALLAVACFCGCCADAVAAGGGVEAGEAYPCADAADCQVAEDETQLLKNALLQSSLAQGRGAARKVSGTSEALKRLSEELDKVRLSHSVTLGSVHGECHLSDSQACPLSEMPRDQTTLVYPGGETRCLSDKDPTYRFQVVPGDPKKLLLFFQGGGACWTESTKIVCVKSASPNGPDGMFERTSEGNPFRSFTIVNILYCSGDMHAGNAQQPWGQQRGYPNTLSVLAWAKDNFPSLSSLVLAGSSAGALGVQFWAQHTLRLFEGRGQTHSTVIADSFSGVGPPTIQPGLMKLWNMCDTVVVREADVVERCNQGNVTIQDVFVLAMESFPETRFANVNSKTDVIQLLFYDIWVNIENQGDLNIEGIRYLVYTNDIFAMFNKNPNYVSFLVNGAQHTFLDLRQLYTADPVGEFDRGVTAKPLLVDWVQDLIESNTSVSTVCHGLRFSRSFWSTFGAGVLYCDEGQTSKLLTAQASA